MSEGLVGGTLEGEEEKPEVEALGALAGAEAFAAAVAAIASRQDPGVARKTEIFLDKQAQLLETQNKHLKEEYALRLTQLRHQTHLLRGQRLGQAFRIAFQVVTVLIAIVIGFGVAVMLHDAFTSRSVVIEPFDAPPALAASGETGKVVASNLLDELMRLRSATHTTRESKREVQSAWSSQVRLAVPEAGISLGELSALLKARFGHDLHISGHLVETPAGGLALTVRGDGVDPKTFVGAGGGAAGGAGGVLAILTTQAAEYVYGQSQPVQWANYLASNGRNAELIAFAREAYIRTDHTDRAHVLDSWAIALLNTGKSRDALPLLRQAITLDVDPHYFGPYYLMTGALASLGDEEGAWRVGEQMRQAAGGRPGRAAEVWYEAWDELTWNLPARRDALVADRDSTAGAGVIYDEGLLIADLEGRLHDPAAAELALNTSADDPKDPSVAALKHFVAGELATQAGDTVRAVMELEAFGKTLADPAVRGVLASHGCWIAPAEEAAGHPDKADAILKTGGTYVDCYRFRADILDQRGDWAAAQKTYADAVALAPNLPVGYYSWGVALARHGDLAGAAAQLKDANQRGPHWADPLKAWGDVLMQQGHTKEALVKYDQALRYAPNWATLKEVREAVAKPKT